MSNYWEVGDKGFLPNIDPTGYNYEKPEIQKVVDLAKNLPLYAKQRCVREEMVAQLRMIDQEKLYEWLMCIADPKKGSSTLLCAVAEDAMRHWSYFASMYIWAPGETPAKRLPKEISIPLDILAKRLERRPILSYASYCLNNWTWIDDTHGLGKWDDEIPTLGKIKLIQNFTPIDDARRDEDWFILVHVEIESQGAKAISAIHTIDDVLKEKSYEGLERCLFEIYYSLEGMNAAFARMPEQCSPEVYFEKVRPYIYMFEDVVYEGVSDDPVSYRGETGAQSSLIPAIQIALGVRHRDSALTEHLDDMRQYMPKEHRDFLAGLEDGTETIRSYIQDRPVAYTLREAYNDCVLELAKFRKTHLQYAVDYIEKKCENPRGTGGTPYVPWLSQLQRETENYLFNA